MGRCSKNTYKKLEAIEQKCLTRILGVNRLAKKQEVNLEARVMPLALRWRKKLLMTYRKITMSENRKAIDIPNCKRLKEKRRKSFIERAEKTMEENKISVNKLKEDTKVIKNKMKIEWEGKIVKERKEDKKYADIKDISKEKIENIHKKPYIAKMWHQAILKTIPTNEYLNKLKIKEDSKCPMDGEVETNEHFVLKCKAFNEIWNTKYPKRNSHEGTTVLEFLNGKNKKEKEKISEALYESWILRESKNKKESKKRKNKEENLKWKKKKPKIKLPECN